MYCSSVAHARAKRVYRRYERSPVAVLEAAVGVDERRAARPPSDQSAFMMHRAGVYSAKGVLRMADVPKPTRGKGQVLIKVAVAGLNPTDWKHLAMGAAKYYGIGNVKEESPVCVGCEGVGTVVEADEGGSFATGDVVWFLVDKMAQPSLAGSCAEFVCVATTGCARVPTGIGTEAAAATPLAALTAYQSLKDAGYSTAGVAKGKRILVHAGAGGVGHFAIQLARIYGFDEIATTCSAENAEFVRSLGATVVCDYKTEDFVARFKAAPFDVVLDPVGGDPVGPLGASRSGLAQYAPRSRKVLKRSGVLVGILTGSSE